MRQARVHTQVIQQRMGHESSRTTTDIYGWVPDETDEEAADALGDLFDSDVLFASYRSRPKCSSKGIAPLTRVFRCGGDRTRTDDFYVANAFSGTTVTCGDHMKRALRWTFVHQHHSMLRVVLRCLADISRTRRGQIASSL